MCLMRYFMQDEFFGKLLRVPLNVFIINMIIMIIIIIIIIFLVTHM
jgi:hypothetical protein